MSQAEKTLLRYNYLMSVSSDMQGDFARTSGTYANQVRLLKLNIQSLASVIGQGLIAAVLPGIQALNALMTKLMQAATVFRDFMYVLMGKKIKGSQSGVVNDLAGLEDTSYDLSGIEDAGDSAADGLDNATSAAKDLKKALSVLPFDELNQLTDNSDNGSSGSGSGSGGTGTGGTGTNGLTSSLGDLLDDAYDVDEISPVNEWAAKIRKAFLAHDWEGLGKTVADGLNKGLQKVYNLFKWDNAKKKIEPFITGFTKTINSLCDNLDWDLMGRTVGAGIDTVAKSFKLLVEGIDFKDIGKDLADAVLGLVDEVSWEDVGDAIGDGFMLSWDLFGGFVAKLAQEDDQGITGFQKLGDAVATTLNHIFKKISFEEIATTLTTGINGAFDALAKFTETFEWDDFEKNLKDGIAKVISGIHWKENGQALGNFLSHLCTAISDMIDDGTFYDLGVKIGEFLGELPWSELLKTAAKLLIKGFGGLLAGLFKSGGFPGVVAGAISSAFLITKVGNILGISNLGIRIIGKLGSVIVGESGTLASKIAKAITGATKSSNVSEAIGGLSKAASGASSSFSLFGDSLLGIFGTAGIMSLALGGIVLGSEQIGKMYDKISGGNGTLSETGTALEAFAGKLKESGQLTNEQLEDMWTAIEADESAGKTRTEMIETVTKKMSDLGITSGAAQTALDSMSGTIAAETFTALDDAVKTLDTDTRTMATGINTSSLTASEAVKGINTVLADLSLSGSTTSGDWQGLMTVFEGSQSYCTTADEAIKSIKNIIDDAGLSFDDFMKQWGEEYPSTLTSASASTETETSAIKSSYDKNIVGAQKTVSTASTTISSDLKGATSGAASSVSTDTASIKSSVDNNIGGAASAVSGYSTDISDDLTSSAGLSYDSVKNNLGWTKIAVNTKMGEIYKNVKSWSGSMYNIQVGTSGKWTLAKSAIEKTLANLNVSVGNKFNTVNGTVKNKAKTMSGYFNDAVVDIKGYFEALPGKVKNALSDMYDIGYNAGQSFANGMKSAYIQKPYLYVESWDKNYYNNGDSWYSTPNFKVGWYAKGGLFDSASVIGVGEAGKEAVLPLENKRTMRLIADSIADSSGGGIGLSHDELSEAVAEGVAIAMMNNSGNNGTPEYAMVNISVGENEFARAITKVQNKYNSRMNPSPVY